MVENLPEQTESDYADMTHVIRAGQERFTRFLAAWLEEHVLAGSENKRR